MNFWETKYWEIGQGVRWLGKIDVFNSLVNMDQHLPLVTSAQPPDFSNVVLLQPSLD